VFEGETVGEMLGAVFRAEPDWDRLPAHTPESIGRLLRRCLEKDPKERLPHIAAARIEIRDARCAAPALQTAPPRSSRVWLYAFVPMTIVALALSIWGLRPGAPAAEMRLEIMTPPATEVTSFAISPDGGKIVFEGLSEAVPALWLRSLDSTLSRPIPRTEGGASPFWSPDSASIGFFADGKLKNGSISMAAPYRH
jgi:hypothetical protein